MVSPIDDLAQLVYQRACAVETTFARLRARDFPTKHFEDLARFPQTVALEIRRALPPLLKSSKNPKVNKVHVERLLRRYGQTLEFVHGSLDFVANAEVLSVPVPFVLFLQALGSRFSDPRFVLQGAAEFNYSFFPVTRALNRPMQLAGLKAKVPDNSAIFRFPASLREDGLQHCILAHELGHFVDISESLSQKSWAAAAPSRKDKIIRFIDTQLSLKRSGLDPDRAQRLFEIYQNWVSEIVCDLFGARILGPSYLYSCVEFVSFRSEFKNGSESHPPPATRLALIANELRMLGWKDEVDRPLAVKIEPPQEWTRTTIHQLPEAERDQRVLERCLLELVPSIRRVVRDCVGTNAFRGVDYRRESEDSIALFGERVPPGEKTGGQPGATDPRTIVNAAWLFHLDKYPGWPELKKASPLRRGHEKRGLLSRLVLKGLEISYIKRRWGELSS